MQKKVVIKNQSAQSRRMPKSIIGTGLIFFILVLSACSTSKPIVKFPVSLGSGTILILPFRNMAGVYGENENVRSPLSGSFFTTGNVAAHAEHAMTKNLTALLQKCSQYTFVTGKKARRVVADAFEENENPVQIREQLVRIGKRLNADWVVAGGVYRFKERVGGAMSVKSAASVAFDIALIEVSSERLLWTGHFDETQKPLSENILKIGSFFKHQGKWASADQLARVAMEEMFKGCLKRK